MCFPPPIRLTCPPCPGALSSSRTTASRPATAVASVDLVEESSATRRDLPLWRASLGGAQMKGLLWSVSAVMYPAFVRAPLRAFSCALRQLALLLRLRRPAGYGFPPNLVRKDRRKDFSGASVNAELRHLGAWPTRLMVPRPRSGVSTNGDNHVSEQSKPAALRCPLLNKNWGLCPSPTVKLREPRTLPPKSDSISA